MVTKAITTAWRFLIGVCCGLCLLGHVQGAQLTLQLKQQRIELGQAIEAQLIAIDSPLPLSDIALAPLHEDFAVESAEGALSDDEDAQNQKRKVQVLELTLYPRRTGTLTVPALTLGDVKSDAQTVTIDPAMEQGGDIQISLHLSSQRVWQRQQITARVDVLSPQRFFALESNTLTLPGFEVVPITTQQEVLSNDPQHRVRATTGWVLLPLVSGKYTLELPMIGYRQSGRIQRKFYLPRNSIEVKSLPAYIPPDMPVARVNINASVAPSGWLRVGNLSYWTITVSANGTLPYWLPPVLHDLQGSRRLEYLPADSSRSLNVSTNGVQATAVHQVPFKALHSGSVALPELKAQYFDPDSGRIEAVTYHPERPLAWSAISLTMLIILSMAVLYLGMRLFLRSVLPLFIRKRKTRRALAMIQQGNTADDLIEGLRYYASAQGWPANLSLSGFASYWRQHYAEPHALADALQRLSVQRYSGHVSEQAIPKLKRELLLQLRNVRRQRVHKPIPDTLEETFEHAENIEINLLNLFTKNDVKKRV